MRDSAVTTDPIVTTARLPRWAKGTISALVIVHLIAVVASPLQFQTYSPGAPPTLVSWTFGTLQPYIDLLYLNHGYAFFAPDPGPNHLVRWRATYVDGRGAVEGVFPDPQEHWPRLRYHRYFMLSEQLHGDYAEPIGPPPESGGAYADWQRRRENYLAKWAAFENRVQSLHDADAVELVRLEHRQPDWYEHQELGMRLNDPSLYAKLGRDVGVAPSAPPEFAPQGQGAPPQTPGDLPVETDASLGPVRLGPLKPDAIEGSP